MKSSSLKSRAVKFVLLIGIMSFFADFTYESSRGIIGQFLPALVNRLLFTCGIRCYSDIYPGQTADKVNLTVP